MSDERMRILEMISDGTITAEQGAQLIAALEESAEEDLDLPALADDEMGDAADYIQMYDEVDFAATVEPERVGPSAKAVDNGNTDFEAPPDFKKWKSFWFIPLGIGIVVTAVSGLLVYAGVQADWNWFWMSCVWFPVLLGILVILFALGGRTSRWLHLRVNTGEDEWPRRIAISLPLPLRTSAWLMRIFGRFIPGLAEIPVPVDEAIMALQESLNPDDPLYINVDESGGAKVEIYIG